MIPDTLEELMSPRSFGLLESRNGLGDEDHYASPGEWEEAIQMLREKGIVVENKP